MIFDGNGAGHCHCDLAKNYPLAFGPRLGIAYQINSKTVFRGGFGVIYGSTESNNNASGGLAGSSNTVSTPSFGDAITTLSVGIPASFNPPPWPNLNPGQFKYARKATPVSIADQPFIDPNAGRPPGSINGASGCSGKSSRTWRWSVITSATAGCGGRPQGSSISTRFQRRASRQWDST